MKLGKLGRLPWRGLHVRPHSRPSARLQLRCLCAQSQPRSNGADATLAVGDKVQLRVTGGLSSAGEGVCRTEGGQVVFVERALPGELVEARVQQAKKSFARAVKLRSLAPPADPAVPACQHFGPCGGCQLQGLDYAAQLRHKQEHVAELLRKVGKVEDAEVLVRPIQAAPQQYGHRNKMEFSFSTQRWQPLDGSGVAEGSGSRQRGGRQGGSSSRRLDRSVDIGFALGLYKPGSNRVVLPISDCQLQPGVANELLRAVGALCERAGLAPYDPITRQGLLQSLVIRTAAGAGSSSSSSSSSGAAQRGPVAARLPAAARGRLPPTPPAAAAAAAGEAGEQQHGGLQVMLNFVTAKDGRRELAPLLAPLMKQFPAVVSVVNTVSDPRRPAGERAVAAEHLLAGRPFLVERLCGLEFEVSANSFFQTSTAGAERLYRLVAEAAELRPTDVVLDLYCGTGTIALALAGRCRAAYGVEVVAPAVRDARRNAERNGITNARFLLGDLDKLASELGARGPAADVVVVDPARQGLSPQVVAYLRRSGARRIVYVSCNPAALARDAALLRAAPEPGGSSSGEAPGTAAPPGGGQHESAYQLRWVQPLDMFPHTMHVESVAVLDRV